MWGGRQRLLDGAAHRLPSLDGRRHTIARQFMDAHDRLFGHVGLHLASAMAHALYRLAVFVCRSGRHVVGGHVGCFESGANLGSQVHAQ